jgi:AcrR family transcriptional regulator
MSQSSPIVTSRIRATQAAQRAEPKPDRHVVILDAAEQCFARNGFHQTSMQEICVAAAMSPGNLYRYFPSKEAIIAGIAKRHREEVAEVFGAVTGSEAFFDGLARLARHHLVERGDDEMRLCVEIMAESRRNPAIAEMFRAVEADVKAAMVAMLRRAAERREISGDIDFDSAAAMLMAIGDGLSWRRASDVTFDAEKILPLVFQMVRCMLTAPPQPPSAEEARS